MASKLYGVNAAIIIFMFVFHFIVTQSIETLQWITAGPSVPVAGGCQKEKVQNQLEPPPAHV